MGLKPAGDRADGAAVTLADRIDALDGWQTARAVPTSIGEVALVAVGPSGVFVVEWAFAGCARTPADVPERPLMHAWALARHLTDVLGVRVTPVLAVDSRLDGVGGRRRGVHVVCRELVPNWLAERPLALDPVRAAELVARLAALGADVRRGEPADADVAGPEPARAQDEPRTAKAVKPGAPDSPLVAAS